MNIDFIKWMIAKADGWSWDSGDLIIFPDGESVWKEAFNDIKWIDTWKMVYYPLLLQRAIEGVNSVNYEISQFTDRVYVTEYLKPAGTPFTFIRYNSIDKAKESALKYIYEQETK